MARRRFPVVALACGIVGIVVGCGTAHHDGSESANAPTHVIGRVPVSSYSSQPAEFVAVTKNPSSAVEAAQAFDQGQKIQLNAEAQTEQTGGTVVQTTTNGTVVEPYPGPVQNNPVVVNGGCPQTCQCTSGCWNFPIVHAIGGFLRNLFRGGVGVNVVVNGNNYYPNGYGNDYYYNRYPVYQVGSYQYGYQYSGAYDANSYRYYVYQGSVCGKNGVAGQWYADGKCYLPGEEPHIQQANCPAGQMSYYGYCAPFAAPVNNQCGANQIMYSNQCVVVGTNTNPTNCPAGQVFVNDQCRTIPVMTPSPTATAVVSPTPTTVVSSTPAASVNPSASPTATPVASASPASCPAGKYSYDNGCHDTPPAGHMGYCPVGDQCIYW